MDQIGVTAKQTGFPHGNPVCYFSEYGETTESDDTAGIVVVRVQIPVVEVEVLIVSLEVQRVLGRLPYFAVFRPVAPKTESHLSGLRNRHHLLN